MKVLLLAFIGAAFVGFVLAFELPDLVKVIPPSGFQPAAIVILRAAPEMARVCADVPEGTLPCRTAAEFREWVRQRK